MKTAFLLLNFFLVQYFWTHSLAQFNFSYNESINVLHNNIDLKSPWAGGLNYVQFSEIDIDYDGDMDLFCFDRSANQIRVFFNSFQQYFPLYNCAYLFPEDIRYRAQMLDYNNDGKNDLFTYGVGGIKVYKNVGNAMDGLQWELSKDILKSDHWGVLLNLYVSSADIPAIIDVDNDSDIDILTYDIGGEFLEYHKNLSQELYGHSDSLVFELRNECWGGFREDLNTNAVTLNDQSSPCQEGNVPNAERKPIKTHKGHSGSTVLALDYDGSGVMDILLGDVAHENLVLLLNGGQEVNSNSLMVSQDVNFPSNSIPVNVHLFPAAFYIDVDFDGKKDLMVSPNAKNVSENARSCFKYKNTGSNDANNFVYETNGFLQNEMIEQGTGSIPVMADMNGDGLLDLFVSNFYKYDATNDKISSIAYYQNTGTATTPQFSLVDQDFQNISTLNLGLRLFPAFGDLNGDTKIDMIIGREDGTLAYFQNNSSGSTPSFLPPVLSYQDNVGQTITTGQYASPQLFDMDGDNLLDLLIGAKNGFVHYYKNTGSITNPKFQFVTNQLGGIDVSENSPDGYATPCAFRWNDTLSMFVGAFDGSIDFYYNILPSQIESEEIFISTTTDLLSLSKTTKQYSALCVEDLDLDGNLDMFLGQDLGGVFHLEHSVDGNLTVSEQLQDEFQIFPNPIKDQVFFESSTPSHICIFNEIGQLIYENENTTKTILQVQDWPKGVYFVQVKGKQILTKKLLKF